MKKSKNKSLRFKSAQGDFSLQAPHRGSALRVSRASSRSYSLVQQNPMPSSPVSSPPRAKAVLADFASPSHGIRVCSNRRNRLMQRNCSPCSSSPDHGDDCSSGSYRPTLSPKAHLARSYRKDSNPGSNTPTPSRAFNPPSHIAFGSSLHASPHNPNSPSEETVVVEKQQPYKTTPPMDPPVDPMFTEVVIVGDIRSQSLDRKRSKTIAVPYLFSSVVHGNLVGLPFRLVAGLAGLFRFSTSNLLCCSLQSCGLYGSAIWLCVVAGVSTSM
ncbi:hypothetical protein NC652_039548 [Populus alba x Populus x berolinensis]|nr:hypothetical protein NC652_040384 [Populus alba x Populus x berolinensis]KAJ6862714.1 hypothetical protein NC652_039548 [Populus alba x Populus x berolinensis]